MSRANLLTCRTHYRPSSVKCCEISKTGDDHCARDGRGVSDANCRRRRTNIHHSQNGSFQQITAGFVVEGQDGRADGRTYGG